MSCNHVWDKDVEGWKPREYIKCVKCGKIFRDFENYVIMLTKDLSVESVLDVGTGRKGPVAEYYWVNYKSIKLGYVCDIWVIKKNLNPIWRKLKMNVLDLLKVLNPKSVDVVQAFGFLEHLKKNDGYQFLKIAEKIAKKAVILSAATCVHGPTRDYKVKKDGNPYHYYWSTWHWKEFEKLGYQTSYRDMLKKITFSEEAIAWKLLNPI